MEPTVAAASQFRKVSPMPLLVDRPAEQFHAGNPRFCDSLPGQQFDCIHTALRQSLSQGSPTVTSSLEGRSCRCSQCSPLRIVRFFRVRHSGEPLRATTKSRKNSVLGFRPYAAESLLLPGTAPGMLHRHRCADLGVIENDFRHGEGEANAAMGCRIAWEEAGMGAVRG